jgi:hypothetical protein
MAYLLRVAQGRERAGQRRDHRLSLRRQNLWHARRPILASTWPMS